MIYTVLYILACLAAFTSPIWVGALLNPYRRRVTLTMKTPPSDV
jgi:hypothetical protein